MDIEIPEELHYTKEHEWAREENGNITVGLSAFAADSLGDIVFVELPNVGETLSQNDTLGVVESVKAVSDIYSPISGEVVETNGMVVDSPEIINQDPYGEGWLIKIKSPDKSELHNLMNATEYEKFVESASKSSED